MKVFLLVRNSLSDLNKEFTHIEDSKLATYTNDGHTAYNKGLHGNLACQCLVLYSLSYEFNTVLEG